MIDEVALTNVVTRWLLKLTRSTASRLRDVALHTGTATICGTTSRLGQRQVGVTWFSGQREDLCLRETAQHASGLRMLRGRKHDDRCGVVDARRGEACDQDEDAVVELSILHALHRA